MMVMLLAFMPPGAIRDRLRGGPDLPKLGFAFNAGHDKSSRTAAVVAAVDVDDQVNGEVKPGLAQPTVTPAGGSALTGPAAVGALLANLRLLRPLRVLLLVPGVRGLLARWLFPTSRPPAATSPPPAAKTPAAAR